MLLFFAGHLKNGKFVSLYAVNFYRIYTLELFRIIFLENG